MGATHVTIRNPAEPDRTWEGLFLVDTGATDCLVPRPYLEGIGLQPKGQRVYELANGQGITLDITTADIEFLGEMVGGGLGHSATCSAVGSTIRLMFYPCS